MGGEDLTVRHAELVKPGRPSGEFSPVGAAKRDVVQTWPARVERCVVEDSLRERVQGKRGAPKSEDDVPKRAGVLVEYRSCADDFFLPRDAHGQVGDRKHDVGDDAHRDGRWCRGRCSGGGHSLVDANSRSGAQSSSTSSRFISSST